jgi:hypothetical protein
MEEREQRLVQAMVDLEDWAAGLRANYDGFWRDIDAERMFVSHKRQELLNLRAQPSVTPEEVMQLCASIAALEAQARTREEDAQKRLAAANELQATSSAGVTALESNLRAATASLEASGVRVAVLEVALGTPRSYWRTHARRGNGPSRLGSSLWHRSRSTAQTCARPQRGQPKLWRSYDSSLAQFRLAWCQRSLFGTRMR